METALTQGEEGKKGDGLTTRRTKDIGKQIMTRKFIFDFAREVRGSVVVKAGVSKRF
jgi:hypothetical protein